MQYLKEKQKTAGPVRRQKAKVSFPVRKPVVVAAVWLSCPANKGRRQMQLWST